MSTPFLGEVKIISWNYPPKGWTFCNGQTLQINQATALFALFGTTYGGNGQTTFALPNLQGRVPLHFGNAISGGSYVLGQVGGETAHTLIQSELPQHTHTFGVSTAAGNTAKPIGAVLSGADVKMYAPATNLTPLVAGSIANAGGSQPHNNLQPYLVLNYIVALQGIFPSRN
jgi:microcystin-dependent protein